MAESEHDAPSEEAEPRGLRCTKCGCAHLLKVRNTIRAFGNKIIRYRICRNCGKRMRSVEQHG